jgi:hypothetical protein
MGVCLFVILRMQGPAFMREWLCARGWFNGLATHVSRLLWRSLS